MAPSDLAQLVARATGESPRTIRRRGFSIVQLGRVDFDPEPDQRPPSHIDWDRLDADRQRAAT
ncbi:MAG: hypothetical protein U0939_22020 [Pirellulales bacterium]